MIKVEIGNHIDANMTHLQGYITSSYENLVKAFGEPGTGDEYKTDVEWTIRFENEEDGEITVATLYHWKNGKNYCGAEGLPIEEITTWNVGGHKGRALELIELFLNGPKLIENNPQKLLS